MSTQKIYRPNVGIAVFNKQGKVLVCRQAKGKYPQLFWQMPQGGVEAGETMLQAAYREVKEETNINQDSIEFLKQASKAYKYDYTKKRADYLGQEQTWVAFKFIGKESEIDVINCPDPCFVEWCWEHLEKIVDITIPSKRKSYEFMFSEFGDLF